MKPALHNRVRRDRAGGILTAGEPGAARDDDTHSLGFGCIRQQNAQVDRGALHRFNECPRLRPGPRGECDGLTGVNIDVLHPGLHYHRARSH